MHHVQTQTQRESSIPHPDQDLTKPLLGQNQHVPRYVSGSVSRCTSELEAGTDPTKHVDVEDQIRKDHLKRGLSARQVQMIALAGTIGTGLFLGTGKSLAEGGPASMLICYTLIGFIVYIVLLLLGEMATQYPVAGSFNVYATRFVDEAFGFGITWNYWFNDAVSVASDLTAAQLVLSFWTSNHLWTISLAFLLFLLSINYIHVRAYGELEYWLSFLKMFTIVAFVILGCFVNVGLNIQHEYIGGSNWRINGAPFVGGFGGFTKVFVTASFAYGGTESLGITAGETKNPTRNMPRVVEFVFWRILIFYVLSVLIIGLNVPYNYPNLSNRSSTTSPFTIVFAEAGSRAAASFINTVILSSVLSAGNHALFAGTRVLYSLSVTNQAPQFISRLNRRGVPYVSLLLTASISGLCFGSSYVGSGQLWGWLQNLVGVSNQLAWLSIGVASYRFRRAWVRQGRSLDDLKFQGARWTRGWGAPFVIFTVSALIIIQGYSAFAPFHAVEFVSLYIQLPILFLMYVLRKLIWRPSFLKLTEIDLVTDEYRDTIEDEADDKQRLENLRGSWRILWRLYYLLA